MKKYLLTGAIVQIIIITLRLALGKSQEAWKEIKNSPMLCIIVLFLCMINIVLWPVAIIVEVISTINGD